MKLTELLEQCESGNIAVSEKAIQRLRCHAIGVLPKLVRHLELIADPKSPFGVGDMRGIAADGLRIAEEVKDHSEQTTTP